MKRICAWCDKVIEDDGKKDIVTHGMCDECFDKLTPRKEGDKP